eukprot:6466829-Amphidinium_carterae.2
MVGMIWLGCGVAACALLHMDDILLVASSWAELLLLAVQASLRGIGLKLNIEKSTMVANIPCPLVEF